MIKSLIRDTRGTVAVYIAIVAPVMAGVGALTMDLNRLVYLNTELQSAADAASLACARELNATTGAIARCRAAAVNAVRNIETFAAEGLAATDIVSSNPCPATPVPPCIRVLSALPANDTDPITAAHVTTIDSQARFGQVFTRMRAVNNISIRLATFGAAPAFSTTQASAVAGSVLCSAVFRRSSCAIHPRRKEHQQSSRPSGSARSAREPGRHVRSWQLRPALSAG